MAIIFDVVLSFLRKFWIPISIIIVVSLLLGSVYKLGYNSGKDGCEKRISQAVVEESERRDKEVEKVRGEMQDIINKLKIRRQSGQNNDKIDSCILSKNPDDWGKCL